MVWFVLNCSLVIFAFHAKSEGYTQAIRNRVTVDWANVPSLVLDPARIPPEVEVKGLIVNNQGRLSLSAPGRIDEVTLAEYRAKRRLQELTFDLARSLTRDYLAHGNGQVPAHVLFPQLAAIVQRFVTEKVRALPPADIKDLFLAPNYDWAVERLLQAIKPDTTLGEGSPATKPAAAPARRPTLTFGPAWKSVK